MHPESALSSPLPQSIRKISLSRNVSLMIFRRLGHDSWDLRLLLDPFVGACCVKPLCTAAKAVCEWLASTTQRHDVTNGQPPGGRTWKGCQDNHHIDLECSVGARNMKLSCEARTEATRSSTLITIRCTKSAHRTLHYIQSPQLPLDPQGSHCLAR
jgi:hypothetical protein